MNSRTIRDFKVPTDIWPVVERWAQSEGFRLLDESGNKRRYQKGHGLLIFPTRLEISQEDGNVHLEAWVHGSIINRVMSLFLLAEETNIDSGGFRAIIPRSIARDSVNRLMINLAQPLIS
ncbi:MAG TPA: hypothetical protein PLP21_05790 [Pyrinomonadaceae bacterium]|nr:hypothetical protein [Acidobacteriota bacterium]HQZ95809.1 hypothetical protein [Pyrinomonadaceae bacterium]